MRRGALAGAFVALGTIAGVRDAAACGGCFHPTAEHGSSVITDHRMVLKVSPTETILWDQVRYSGDPSEFAWVLPVHAGARVELSRDAWIAALDAATQSSVRGPEISCASAGGGAVVGGPSGGRPAGSSSSRTTVASGGGGCGSSDSSGFTNGDEAPNGESHYGGVDGSASGASNGSTQFAGNEDVQVVSQDVIGPYEAVTIHSSDGKGIGGWLTDNGFAIPPAIQPVVDAYTKASFDFIALKLRPDAGVRAMRPVRIVTPGADATLPLRMVAAGVGSHVGLTLWVVSEGRYHTQNFPDAKLDWSELAWNGAEDRSNLRELTAAALAANGGRGWLTEAAIQTGAAASASGANPALEDAYRQQCQSLGTRTEPCDPSELPSADGGGAADGGALVDASSDPDAAASGDAGTTPPAPACTKTVSGCDGFDDLDVATRDLHAGDIWITRLRADLPVGALGVDLVLEAASDQSAIDPAHQTQRFTDPAFDPCPAVRAATGSDPSVKTGPFSASPPAAPEDGCSCRTSRLPEDLGTAVVIGVGAVGASIASRRRRRRRRA